MSTFHFWWKVMRAAAVVLDIVSYKNREGNYIKDATITLYNHFKEPLEANDFLKQQFCEFGIIFKIFISWFSCHFHLEFANLFAESDCM